MEHRCLAEPISGFLREASLFDVRTNHSYVPRTTASTPSDKLGWRGFRREPLAAKQDHFARAKQPSRSPTREGNPFPLRKDASADRPTDDCRERWPRISGSFPIPATDARGTVRDICFRRTCRSNPRHHRFCDLPETPATRQKILSLYIVSSPICYQISPQLSKPPIP